MPPEVQALAVGLGIAGLIAILLLVFGERPGLAASVKRHIGRIGERDDRGLLSDLLSSKAGVPASRTINREQRSDAGNRPMEPSGTEDRNAVPSIVEQLEAMDDDALLDILALMRDAAGEYRFAESRVAKFIPGRVDDRLTQVREARHTEPPLPPGRMLQVRDTAGERAIPM